MAVRVKREPSSNGAPADCYVCGGSGASHALAWRPRERGASYFPFLEHHEAPPSARRPSAECEVLVCALCFSVLNQQWDAYEKSRTPHAKRIYWMKRVDNGHYLGADMALQGDYASQVIGVSPEPGSGGGHGHCSSAQSVAAPPARLGRGAAAAQHRGASTPHLAEEYYPAAPYLAEPEDGYGPPAVLLDLRGAARTPGASPRPAARKAELPAAHSAPNGALDLSMPDKNAASEACYLCGDEVLRGTLVSVYAKTVSNCPFFPSLMLHPRPGRSRPMDSFGCVQACAPCYQHLLQQWDAFQRQSVPHAERRYQLGGRKSKKSPPPPPVAAVDFACFLCGKDFPWNLRHALHAGANAEGEPPLPFLERVKPARGAAPLSAAGQALACAECYRAVHRQRHAYMDTLRDDHKPVPAGQHGYEPPHRTHRDYEQQAPPGLTCHVCRQTVPRQHARFADAPLDSKLAAQGFYPACVREDGDGLPVCVHCCGALTAQWEAFEEDRVPYHQRRYAVPPAGRKASAAGDGGVHHEVALRIRVPSPEPEQRGACGAPLLTTVSTASDSPASVISVGQHSRGGNALDLSSGTAEAKPRPAKAPQPGLCPTCYVCGLAAQGVRTYAVRSFPAPKGDAEAPAFFPFLALHPAPPDAEPVGEDGTALACTFCYHSLMSQWAGHEAAREHGPWSRGYNCHDYVCYVCGVTTYRKRVKAISVADFPFLVAHPRPPGSLVLDAGDGVAVCLMCHETLSSQWNDFERMKVPLELRKYNWIAAPPPPEDDEPAPGAAAAGLMMNGESPSDYRKPIVIDDDELSAAPPGRRISRQETPPQQMPGLSHGKPPPLTPSGCGPKPMVRGPGVGAAPAAPPSLSQMSPNGTGSQAMTTSSFAAALRKLAEHAIDTCDKDMPPLSPVTSPRSTPTPKRVPPSLVHASAQHPSSAHSHPAPSNFSSPPVVAAGAPAPSHTGYADGRKVLDRSSSGPTRDPAKSSSHSNHHRSHSELSREDGRPPAMAYGDVRRDADMSPAKGFLMAAQAAEGMGAKSSGTQSGYYGDNARDEHAFVVNGLATSQQLQHMRSRQSSSAGSVPRLESSGPPHLSAASSGFHPYRSPSEDARHGLAQHVPPAYEQTSPYGYHPAASFLPHHMSHPPFRLDDQLYLERYGILRSPLFPMPHPGLAAHHNMPFMAGARYPPELLSHHLGLVSPTGHLLAQERIKLEEQQQQRREMEMELYQEQERRRERDREREREREKEREWERERDREHAGEAQMLGRGQQQDIKGHQKAPTVWPLTRRAESPARPGVIGSITQGTPRDLVIHTSTTPHRPPSCSPGPAAAKPPSAAAPQPHWNNTHYFPYAAREANGSPHQTISENIANKLYPPMSHHRPSPPPAERERPSRDMGCGSRSVHEASSERHHPRSSTSSLLSYLPHTQKPRSSSPSPTSHHHPQAPDATTAPEPGRRASVISEPPLAREARPRPGRNHSTAAGITVEVDDGNVPWCSRFSPSLSAPALMPVVSAEGFAAAQQESRAVGNGLKSKLDLAAERARLRSGDEASDEEDGADESRWSRLLVIASGPPLPLDDSKEKLSFFAYFGLTTQKKKREIELDKIVRRQKRLRDPTLPALDGIPGRRTFSTLWFLSHAAPGSGRRNAEALSREKVQFLSCLGLDPMPEVRKEEHEQILKAVVEERIKRNGHSHPVHYRPIHAFRSNDQNGPSGSKNPEFKDLVNKGTKRKCEEADTPPKRAKSLLANSTKKIANLPTRRPSDASAMQSLLPIVSGPIIRHAREQMLANSEIPRADSAVALSSSSSSNATQPQLYGRDFAQEFHESVLLQTQLKSRATAVKKVDPPPEKAGSADVSSVSDVHASSRVADPAPHSSSHVPHKTHRAQLRWPGIEVLMEAYERHEQEQTLEKEVLSEQCLRLRTQNRKLNEVMDKLTQSMANLIHIKKELDEERHCHHQAIDGLKHILKRLR